MGSGFLPLLVQQNFQKFYLCPSSSQSHMLAIGACQGACTGERGSLGRAGGCWDSGPHGGAEDRQLWGRAGNMSPGERDLGLWGGGAGGYGLLSTFSPPLCHEALHPSFLWHCLSYTAVLRPTTRDCQRYSV